MVRGPWLGNPLAGNRIPMWTEIERHPQLRRVREKALVLDSAGVPYRLGRDGRDHVLAVPFEAAPRAAEELRLFEAESAKMPLRGTPVRPSPVRRRRAIAGSLVYAVVLLVSHAIAEGTSLGPDLRDQGKTFAAAIRDGAWWRTVTALFLHADLPHVTSNVLFGALFGGLVASTLGNGRAWLSILVGGALGNYLNAWVRDASHTSIGASTAVFAALGLLSAIPWRQQRERTVRRSERWAPLVFGLVLLGLIGGGGERTDVTAHGLGMLCGMGLGWVWSRTGVDARRSSGMGYLAGAILTVGVSWFLALR